MKVKLVNGYSGGCNSSHTYCDGKIHVQVNWETCHHSLDYDNPDDIESTVNVMACNESRHHDKDTCYECNEIQYPDCDFYHEFNPKPENYELTPYLIALVEEFKKTGRAVKRSISWTARVEGLYPKAI